MNSLNQQTLLTPSAKTPGGGTHFEPGVVLRDTYRIIRPLAVGGMGEVYIANHERLSGTFAVKVLHHDLVQDPEALARFRSEAEIMAGLRHPNIVQVIDFDVTSDGTPYLVMELVEGKDLSEYLSEGRKLPPAKVAHIIHQIASALEAAHTRGVVHRDLKPENIMLLSAEGQEDFIKVVDFGISKARHNPRITAEAAILGTPQFMAPEQAQGRRDEVDHRTDQFALASMTYTLLTGREPFRGDTAVAILYQVVHQVAEPLDQHLDWPCERVDAVLRRGMAKDRNARFSSILEFARALDEALAEDLAGSEVVPYRRTATPRGLVMVGGGTTKVVASVSKMKTVRLAARFARKPRMAAAGLVAMAALATVVYLDAVGWDNVGSNVGVVYRSAVAATSRTVSRWRNPGPTELGPEVVPAVPTATPAPTPVLPARPHRPALEPLRTVGALP